MGKKKDSEAPMGVTDIAAVKSNAALAVEAFADRFISMPRFTLGCLVMDQGQLRDAMGARAVFGLGDPWPAVEQELIGRGFRWHSLGGMRVMYLMERDGYEPDDGWQDGKEV